MTTKAPRMPQDGLPPLDGRAPVQTGLKRAAMHGHRILVGARNENFGVKRVVPG